MKQRAFASSKFELLWMMSHQQKKRKEIVIFEGWSCDKCTYKHRYPAQICAMCNANRIDEDNDGNETGASSSSSA